MKSTASCNGLQTNQGCSRSACLNARTSAVTSPALTLPDLRYYTATHHHGKVVKSGGA